CIRSGEVDLVINTPTGSGARADGYEIRTAAVRHGIPCVTTMTGASAASRAIFAAARGDAEVRSLQELHEHESGAASSAPATTQQQRRDRWKRRRVRVRGPLREPSALGRRLRSAAGSAR